jgi:hypothetical protein
MFEPSRAFLLLSLQRALLGNVSNGLRQASIEADVPARLVRLRFEYDPGRLESDQENCSSAAAEVVSDLPADWDIREQHLQVATDRELAPLAHVAYRRAAP